MEIKERTRYNDQELQEFKELILQKLESAKAELKDLTESGNNVNGTDDTGSVYKTMEDGSSTLLKESNSQMAGRQRKFIDNLEMALLRIENKTYGICKVTGKLIPKERLMAVPHTTQSMEAKLKQYK
jgi:DnaK suppressor protein